MKKRIGKIILCSMMAIAFLPYTPVSAEDYTDTDAWNDKCNGPITTDEDYNACNAYREYIAKTSPDLQAQLDEINAQKDSIAADIASYREQYESYQKDVDAKNATISDLESKRADLQSKIEDTQKEIDEKQTEIDAKQKTIEALKAKLKQRMENGQKSLRVNNMIDILMGAKTFSDFLRIATGLNSITSKENEENQQLVAAMEAIKAAQDALKTAQDQLVSEEADLKSQEDEIQSQKEELLIAQYKVQVIQEIAQQKETELYAQSNVISASIDSARSTMTSIQNSLNAFQEKINGNNSNNNYDLPSTSNGFVRPVTGGIRTAGTWDYAGGWGTHLGYDFGVPYGTPVYSVGSGVVLGSVSGCGYGYLGNACGGPDGIGGGGNQIHEVVVVGDKLYGVVYYHLSSGLVPVGTIVNAGDQIALSGSSGNSTGPHLHLEIMYLGDASNFSNYVSTWNGDLTFGTGWAGGYGRRCDHGYDAPCRVRPEDIYGY